MFGKKKKSEAAASPVAVRKLIHDLRAKLHAASLNVEAAQVLAGKLDAAQSAKLKKSLANVNRDLSEFKSKLEELSALLK